MTLEECEATLNEHGWSVVRTRDGSLPGEMVLPCGTVHWIDGVYQGVERSGWLRPSDGLVMLHGSAEGDDCLLDEFVRRCVVVEVVDVAKKIVDAQRTLF